MASRKFGLYVLRAGREAGGISSISIRNWLFRPQRAVQHQNRAAQGCHLDKLDVVRGLCRGEIMELLE